MPDTSPLIDVSELAASLGDVVVIDASWVYPPFNSAGIDLRQRYCERHIPGSWFLDLASLSRAAPSLIAASRRSRGHRECCSKVSWRKRFRHAMVPLS